MTSVDSAEGETCFTLSVLDDTVLEEPLECLLLKIELPEDFSEMLLSIAPGNDSTLCCITDDDSEFVILIHMITFFNSLQGPSHNCICLHMNFVCA